MQDKISVFKVLIFVIGHGIILIESCTYLVKYKNKPMCLFVCHFTLDLTARYYFAHKVTSLPGFNK